MSFVDTLREPHFMGFVIFDWLSTIVGAGCISYYSGCNFAIVLIVLLVLSVFLHVYYKIDTKMNSYLGLNSDQ